MFVTDVSTTFLRDPVTWRMRHHHSKHHGTETTILPPVNQYVNITVNNFNVSVVSNHREKVTYIALWIHPYSSQKVNFIYNQLILDGNHPQQHSDFDPFQIPFSG